MRLFAREKYPAPKITYSYTVGIHLDVKEEHYIISFDGDIPLSSPALLFE